MQGALCTSQGARVQGHVYIAQLPASQTQVNRDKRFGLSSVRNCDHQLINWLTEMTLSNTHWHEWKRKYELKKNLSFFASKSKHFQVTIKVEKKKQIQLPSIQLYMDKHDLDDWGSSNREAVMNNLKAGTSSTNRFFFFFCLAYLI